MSRPTLPTFVLAALLGLATLPPRAAADDPKGEAVELFRDDFSRYPAGPLTRPVGNLNGAIEEYHHLPHRGVPLGPWANVICHLDAWAAGRDGNKPYLEQTLRTTGPRMIPTLFSPIFLTGEPEWHDCAVEATVRPLSADGSAGLVFGYRTNRQHYVFTLQNGKQARLAQRLPLETAFRVVQWKEHGTADFPYDGLRAYRLRVETRGLAIKAYIDGKLVLSAEAGDLPAGKVGVAATGRARFEDFRVTVSPLTKQAIDDRIRTREAELTKLRAENPLPKVWKKFETPGFGAGRNVRFGDLDGDGVADMLIGQCVQKTDTDAAVEITCLTAVTLDGKVLWQLGKPDPANGLLTCDTPFQIHDLDGDGRSEVVLAMGRKLQVLDGRTGAVKKAVDVPRVKSYPKVPQAVPKNWPTDVSSGDSLVFANFSGGKGRGEIVLKDRYWNFWVFDRDLKPLWDGQGMLGHYPFPAPGGPGGRDRLAIGYSLWDHTGKQLWSADQLMKDHADSVFVGNITGDPAEQPTAYYCCSDEGVLFLDHRGVVRNQVRVGHAQTACVGKFRPELPGLQFATINFWRNPGIVSLFDAHGRLLQQAEPVHTGSPFLPVNWRGDGREFILLSGSVKTGGMLDGRLRRAVVFPDDGHPDLCAAALDLTGDPRDEIVLWDQKRVWVYTQDRPFAGGRIYAPERNPHGNESNYRCNYSLPGWKNLPRK